MESLAITSNALTESKKSVIIVDPTKALTKKKLTDMGFAIDGVVLKQSKSVDTVAETLDAFLASEEAGGLIIYADNIGDYAPWLRKNEKAIHQKGVFFKFFKKPEAAQVAPIVVEEAPEPVVEEVTAVESGAEPQ